MKTIFIIVGLLTSVSTTVYSQKKGEVIRQQACDISKIAHQIDSVKQLYQSQGFLTVREASMGMESEYEMPVIVPFNEGTFYHIVFIGDPSISLMEVRMYDYNERQIIYEKNLKSDQNANVISFSYIAKFSEYHMIKPVQVVKKSKDTLCGYILLMKKVK